MLNPLIETYDGVGVLVRGNVIVALYAADARLHRTRWLFDRVDALLARSREPVLGMIIVAENAGPPDAPTRAENGRRFKQIAGSMKALVTVALGDAFQASIVRTVMRASLLLQGQSSWHFVASTTGAALDQLLRSAGPTTPQRSILESDLEDLFEALKPGGVARTA